MIRFEAAGDFFELELARVDASDLPSKGDAYVTVRVDSAGFCGHNDLWVPGAALAAFCADLIALERSRHGNAELNSISPDELALAVRSIDSRGHLAVEGSTGYDAHRDGWSFWHSVHFGFEFDPSQLVRATTVDWVRKLGTKA
jgi:hypothetical protein